MPPVNEWGDELASSPPTALAASPASARAPRELPLNEWGDELVDIQPELRSAEAPGLLTRAREALSPLIGETSDQTLRREQRERFIPTQFPEIANQIAEQPGTDRAAERRRGGAITAVEQAVFTPAPGTPQIPMIPQQEGTAAQVGAGVVNALSTVVNMLPTPGGLVGAMGGGPGLIALGAGAPSMVRAGVEGVETLASDEATTQDKAGAATGLGLMAAGGAAAARARMARTGVGIEPPTPGSRAGRGAVIDAEVVGDASPALDALPAADLRRLGGGRTLELTAGDAPPAPPSLLALPESAPLSTAKPPLLAETNAPAAPAAGTPRRVRRMQPAEAEQFTSLAWVPRGEPGVSIEAGPNPPAFGGGWIADSADLERRVVFRDASGAPKGYLRFYLNEPGSKAVNAAEGLSVFVAPDARRQGVASQLYATAQAAGYDVMGVSGSGAMSEAGQALSASLRPAPRAVGTPAAPLKAAAEEAGTKAAPEFSGAEDPVALAPERKPAGRSFRLSPLPDGTADLLNVIEELGGVRGPRAGQKGGEYDGFSETFNAGLPRLLRNRSGQAVDQLMVELDGLGYRFQTPDDFYRAVNQAVETRRQARVELERQMEGDKFVQAALENRGRSKGEAAAKPVPVDTLVVGDKFKVKREAFEVVDVDPDTLDLIVRDGPRFGTQVLPAGSQLFADRRSLRRVPRKDLDQWPDMESGEAATPPTSADANEWGDLPAETSPATIPFSQETTSGPSAAPAQPLALKPGAGGSTPPPATNLPARGQNLGLFDGGETGGDTTFNLMGETATDFTGAMDAKAAAAEARAAAARAQGSLFGGQSLGIAAGADTFAKIQRILAPETLLPAEFRQAVRFGEQAQRAILQEGRAVQLDLSRAMDTARKTVPDIDAQVGAYLTGQRSITTLPAAVQPLARRARLLVDGLSERAIREGVVSGQLAQTFADNQGKYLRRAYRIFEDAGAWFADPEFYATARPRWLTYLQGQVNPATKRPYSRAEAELLTAQLLDKDAAQNFMIGGKIAGRDVSSLMARKDLVPELRALYGEITDPLQMLGQTIPRMARLIENHAAQQWIRLSGLRTGLFTTTPDPLRHRELVADTNKPHEVWRGLYTTPEIADAMTREASTGRAAGVAEGIWRMVRSATAFSKMSKTVLNPDSYAPNFIGGVVVALANGNFNVLPLARGLLLGAEELGALRASGVLPRNRAGLQADIAKLTKLGLRGESITGADLVQTWERSLLPAMLGRVSRVVLPWLKGYGAIDDATKYMGWKSELARLQSWNPGMPLAAAERMAAERVRATMPTYSQIPKFVRELSQIGIAPSFVNFTWEMYRTTYNSARIALGDMRDGARAGNAAQVRDGARRLAALTTVVAASTGLGIALITKREHGITEEQDEAVRFFGAPWNREAQLVYSGPVEDGRVQFANSSYLLPHALLTQAIEAAARAKTDEEAGKAFLNTFKEQFLSADGGVLIGPAAEAFIGHDRATGRPILNRESLTPTVDALRFLYDRSFDPLLRKKLERMIMAAREEKGPFGRVYSLQEEAARLAGVRAQTLDFNLAADFKARELGRRFAEASNIYNSMRGRAVKPEMLETAYQAAQKSRERVFGEVLDYLRLSAAVGVPEERAIKALRQASGLGPDIILGALEGRYVPQAREARENMAEAVERLGELPAAQAEQELLRLATQGEAFTRAIRSYAGKQMRGITQRDELLLGLGVRDGARANYIRQRVATISDPAAAQAYLIDLARKGVITEEVRAQLTQ